MSYPVITPGEARVLANKTWTLGDREFRFGERPMLGSEAFVYPLYDSDEQLVAFVRFSLRVLTPERLQRTQWLIGQRLDEKTPVFKAAPYSWLSTFQQGRPDGVSIDFVATLHAAVRGESWRAIKRRCDNEQKLPLMKKRIAAAKQLISHLAILESIGRHGFIHGDVSDGNFMIDLATGEAYLIDFDAFIYTTSDTLKFPRLSFEAGGVKGTIGYMPPELEESTAGEAFPFSDRYARDMLLIELLGFQLGDPIDASPKFWEEPGLTQQKLQKNCRELSLTHLLRPDVFELPEKHRPCSRELAVKAQCQMPDCKIQLAPFTVKVPESSKPVVLRERKAK
ncbi:phosphotransferase [Bythopirellula goksoeyrii]|uniref:Protein kinase domain-containing protein n=1 Tax=Bythopirellula goksoeyrii TaxID=1400387 RepID=A0A5B9QJK2_9BACT|nr:serine/threonine-protein kinase [Bythopirellula goksoeyrii]QEG37715.1 hypothetical protein Pr1d_50610 [Bythopirellula goksoeyrii]